MRFVDDSMDEEDVERRKFLSSLEISVKRLAEQEAGNIAVAEQVYVEESISTQVIGE